jgi:tetratricopeptide (TPR) repeat protein
MHQQGQLDQAEAIYKEILQSQAQHFDALRLLATIAAQRKNSAAAVELFEQALKINPDHASSLNNRGNALLDLKRHKEALESYDRALEIEPDYAEALYNRGNALLDLKRHEEALQSYDRALKINPDYAEALYNRGSALRDLERHEEALESYDRALKIKPDYAEALCNRGNALLDLGRHEEALQSYERALEIEPDYAEVHLNRALVWLLLGDFQRGWPEHEWRWQRAGFSLPQLSKPRWSGEPLNGRTILLSWEQGLGDTLQFVRYARLLQRQGARVIVSCQKPLVRLLQRCEGIDQLVAQGEPLPDFDFWTPLLSIPYVLRTDRESIPGECGYLSADPALVARWKIRLANFPGFRIAIAWQGNPGHQADRQRSIPLKFFAQLAQVPGVRLISLQTGPGVGQLADIAGSFEIIQFEDLDTTSGPFMDTAAIMRNVDLSISCDTSLAHLAGALGVPVWLAQAFSADWRWLLDRDDSPWYPSLRSFRQQSLGDWDEVFLRMARTLRERHDFASAGSGPTQRLERGVSFAREKIP